jgi:hypothetical protein
MLGRTNGQRQRIEPRWLLTGLAVSGRKRGWINDRRRRTRSFDHRTPSRSVSFWVTNGVAKQVLESLGDFAHLQHAPGHWLFFIFRLLVVYHLQDLEDLNDNHGAASAALTIALNCSRRPKGFGLFFRKRRQYETRELKLTSESSAQSWFR